MTENEALVNGALSENELSELNARLGAKDDNEILLADVTDDSKDIVNTPGLYLSDDSRQTHMHVLGSSGGGKSKLLEFMLRQDIDRGVGVCLIDPHGELYWNILRYIFYNSSEEVWRKLYLLNPSQKDYMMAYNPLMMKRGDHKSHSMRLLESFDKIFDGEIGEKGGLYDALKNTFKFCALRNYSTHEAKLFLSSKDYRKKILTTYSSNPLFDSDLEEFLRKSVEIKEFEQILYWTKAKLDVLSESTPLEMMTLPESSLDLAEIINQNGILLVNLAESTVFNKKSSRTLGTVLISELISNFKANEERNQSFITGNSGEFRPFYLYVDEFHEVYTDDYKDILTGGRKFGLHLILANQEFAHLSENIKTTIKSVGNKVYFPVRDYHEAEEIYLQLGKYDDRIKDEVISQSSIPSGYTELPSQSNSYNQSGGMTTTNSVQRLQNYHIVETAHRQYYTPEEIKLMEGKKFQLLPKRHFLFHNAELFQEGVYLKTDWVFNYPLSMDLIERLHMYVADEHEDIYEKVSVLSTRLKELNTPKHYLNSEKKSIAKDDTEDPFS